MTAELVEDVTLRMPRRRDWAWADLQEIPDDGHRYVLLAVEAVSPSSRHMDRLVKPAVLADAGVPAYWRVEMDGPGAPLVAVYALERRVYREVVTIRAGESANVDPPLRVEVRPAELVGPRRRG